MASAPIGSFQGLASGIQWQDMIDQLMQVDSTRELTPLTTKAAQQGSALAAWNSYGDLVTTLRNASKGLADGSAFATAAISAPNSPSTGRTLLTATATSSAPPGSYTVQVLGTAAAQQLSGNIVSDATAVLGLNGQFIVGGRTISVASGDSLNAVRDKINAVNTGDSASHVSATILYTGGSAARLVLTSDTGGASGIDLRDARANVGDPSLVGQLGFSSGTAANVGLDGRTRSAAFSSTTATVAAMSTGVTAFPPSSTISVNGQAIAIDVSTKSLTDIAAAINAQQPNTASVETVTSGATTSYRLNIAGTVAATAAPGSQPVLDLLGLTHGLTGAVKQQVTTSNVLQDAGGTTAVGSTLLSGLKVAGGTGAQIGDTFTISGTKSDGTTPVNLTVTVDGTKTIDDLLTTIGTAFSASGRSVSAAVVGGKIQLTDDTGGESALSLSISANNESTTDPLNPATLSFGAATTTTVGRQRELAAGRDARMLVNGILVTRATNTIDDAITGVTLNLKQAEVGTTIPVTVTRDVSQIVSAVQSLASSYNVVQSWVTTNTAADGPLPYNSAVRQTLSTLKNALLANVAGLPSSSTLTHAAVAGIAFNKTGALVVDSTALTAALNSNPDAVAGLFKTNGVMTGTDFSYMTTGAASTPGAYDVSVTRAATQSSVLGWTSNFVYSAGGSTDTMTISDATSAKSGDITLADGDTTDSVVQKLNALFTGQGMRLVAANQGGQLSIKTLDYGTPATFSIAYTSSNHNDIAAQTGIAAATINNGLDVQGSYTDGTSTYAATGKGQLLTGNADTPVNGLVVRYAGTANTGSSHLDFAVGLAGIMNRIADQVSRAGDGTIVVQTAAISARIDDLTLRQSAVQARLDNRRAALTRQFTAMETAMSKLQQQSAWLTNQVNAMNGVQSSSK